MTEIWKDVVGYEGRYKVSNLGNVWSCLSQRLIKNRFESSSGNAKVTLRKDGNSETVNVQNLVCAAFLGVRPNGYQIDHIDRNRANNNIDNLRYVTPSENQRNRDGYTFGDRIKIKQIDRNGNVVNTYISINDASRETGISKGNICSVCKGNRLTAGGYRWEYVNEN